MQALILFLVLLALVAPVLALVALVRGEGGRTRMRALEDEVRTLEARLGALSRRVAQQPGAGAETPAAPFVEAPRPAEAPAAAEAPRPLPETPPPPIRPLPIPTRPLPAPAPAPAVPGPPPRRTPPSSPSDFATNLGPRLLVGTGALACVVFLALFVKYAWENDWVGPAGRVLMGAATGVALVAAGVRLLGGRYRPLGQGLSGAGLAGLYVSAFGAHGFYDLISRELAGVLMAAITVSAVLLAARLDARLLAALAWIGGYMTPVMLSTGEDRAVALFLYLALIDLGALALDHFKPWPETAPLAAAGTVLLYGAWFSRFYTPERFGVAAFGLVLFTALFAIGMARKARPEGMAGVVTLSTIGLLVLAGTADRPLPLMAMSLVLAALCFFVGQRLGVLGGILALGASGLPFIVWGLEHYRAQSFGIAAAWVTSVLLLFLLRPLAGRAPDGSASPAGDGALIGLVLAGAGVVSAVMTSSTDAPLGLAAFLLAQAGVAILARSRWAWAEVAGVTGAALTTAVWLAEFFKDGRQGDAWLIAFPAAGAYLIALVARGLGGRAETSVADVFAYLGNATLVWITLFNALYDTAPGALALASVGLAALYLCLGLATLRERPEAVLLVRTTLGLAAVFLTIAIPVRLGLHGITLAWALEGVLLLGLGLRYRSPLARGGAYAVLALAALRLLVRHYPLRGGEEFTPVFNAGFGTWLAVIAALAAAALLGRGGADAFALDRAASVALSVAALVLLFGLVSDETARAFEQTARLAHSQGDMAGAAQAHLRGRFALSLLWTVFSTLLLAGGLGLRSRPLFYAGYGLFAVTALKVVFVDTATLHTLYRMLSFLALGLLLLAGAYLNLRFRERLLPREAVT